MIYNGDLLQEINQKSRELSASLKQLRVSGSAKAEAEKNYKIKLREEALKLREENTPVTMIDKVVYGIPSVAELRFKRDIADTVYQANLEAINTTKLMLRLLENQLSREWGAKDGGV